MVEKSTESNLTERSSKNRTKKGLFHLQLSNQWTFLSKLESELDSIW